MIKFPNKGHAARNTVNTTYFVSIQAVQVIEMSIFNDIIFKNTYDTKCNNKKAIVWGENNEDSSRN